MCAEQPVAQALLDPPETKVQADPIPSLPAPRPPLLRFKPPPSPPPDPALIFRHSGWADDRLRVYQALRAAQQSVSRIAGFATCGLGAYVLQSLTEPNRYRVAGSTCHDRFCLPCASQRSRIIAHNVITQLGKNPCRLVTLTIRHDKPNLRDGIKHLYDSFRKLQRTRFWSRRVTGGVAFLELTYNHQALAWHPHLHLIAEGKFIPQKLLSRTWAACTGGSYVVHVTLAGGPDKVARYVTKYASKPLAAVFLRNPDLLREAVIALKGRRMCMTWGAWRGVKLTEAPNDDEWVNLGPLEDWLARAARGDREARAILHGIDALGAEKALASFPPPAPARPPPSAAARAQLALFGPVAPSFPNSP